MVRGAGGTVVLVSLLGYRAAGGFMRRRLNRLFTFASATKNSALENFTTEALANALELDPSPFLHALPGELAAIIPPDRAQVKRVETQVRIERGTLDLVVDLLVDDLPLSLWIEVKAHAGLSGEQLEAYASEAQRRPHTTHVLMLCKYPLTGEVPTLRWNVLRAKISRASHEYWLDLRDFLEDHQMADDFDTPVTAAELKVAHDARALLRKVVRLSREFLRLEGGPGLPEKWYASKFPEGEKKLTAAISRQFARHGRLVVDSRCHPWTCFGLDFRDGPQLRFGSRSTQSAWTLAMHCSRWRKRCPRRGPSIVEHPGQDRLKEASTLRTSAGCQAR